MGCKRETCGCIYSNVCRVGVGRCCGWLLTAYEGEKGTRVTQDAIKSYKGPLRDCEATRRGIRNYVTPGMLCKRRALKVAKDIRGISEGFKEL